MKNLILLLLTTLTFTVSAGIIQSTHSVAGMEPSTVTVEDGWYSAIVKYSNYSTGTISKYRLNVKVQYNQVVAISFGSGGSVHTGFNNEGYLYNGGNLMTDYYGNVTATVSISQGSQLLYYYITLE